MEALQLVEHNGKRILTTAQIAAVYETDSDHIRRNYSNNKDHYVLGKHYFLLEGEELKQFKKDYPENLPVVEMDDRKNLPVVNRVNRLYLWTEKGALMHAKSLNTDKAWEVYEMLVDEYYRMTETQAQPVYMSEALRQRALANEKRVPSDLFSTQLEIVREIHDSSILDTHSFRCGRNECRPQTGSFKRG